MDVSKYSADFRQHLSTTDKNHYTSLVLLTDCQWGGYKTVESELYGVNQVPYILLNFSRFKDGVAHNQLRQIRFTMTPGKEFDKFWRAYNGESFVLKKGQDFGEEKRSQFCKELQTEIRANNFNFRVRWVKDEDSVGVYRTVWKIYEITKIAPSIKRSPEFLWDKKAMFKYPILEFNNAELKRLNEGGLPAESTDEDECDDSITDSMEAL